MADPEKQETPAKPEGQQPSDGTDGGDIGLNIAYITSIPGILKIVEFVCTGTFKKLPVKHDLGGFM